ncbi:glycosyltransferase family 4 protein [Bordetella genomosp. 11]|uniref:Glycosyl transferase group 1 n=1 Tax=Bordetella genomosp. 11 TaxID=1416808 RepID=A0A261UMW3_9BORD|nr:glycosyltransferase family 4 protein [Bordetella genomosp. 11]OZI62981.1 glycosyl transferase group 1 [Bordetella genomosp. 11]
MSIQAWKNRFSRAVAFSRDRGLKALFVRVFQVVLNPAALDRELRQSLVQDVRKHYWFVQKQAIGQTLPADAIRPNTVNWFVPDVGRGSGGHLNIFRFISYLEEQGFECRIVAIGDNFPNLAPEQLKKDIANWYFPLKAETYVGAHTAPPAAMSFATAWQTAYIVRNFQPTLHKCYFVQDFEPWFAAAGSQSALAEETYRFGFMGITAGSWLADRLKRDYGMTTYPLGFSYARDLYVPPPDESAQLASRRIFFYARPSTPRRGFELGILVLSEVARRMPDVTMVMAGGSLRAYQFPFKFESRDIVKLSDLPQLYGTCSAALVLSFSNLSLLPLELMACGVPVVSNRGPNTEWLLNESNARLEPPTVEALADAICDVLQNPAEAKRLREGGLKAAGATDWATEGLKLGQILQALQASSVPNCGVEQHG